MVTRPTRLALTFPCPASEATGHLATFPPPASPHPLPSPSGIRVPCWGLGWVSPRALATVGPALLFPPVPTSLSPRALALLWARTGGREGWAAKGQAEPRPGRQPPHPCSGFGPHAQRRASALMAPGFRECPQGHVGDSPFHYCLRPPSPPFSHGSPGCPLPWGAEGCCPTMTGSEGFSRGSFLVLLSLLLRSSESRGSKNFTTE